MNDFSGWLARSVGIGHELASKVDRLEWHWARPEVLFWDSCSLFQLDGGLLVAMKKTSLALKATAHGTHDLSNRCALSHGVCACRTFCSSG